MKSSLGVSFGIDDVTSSPPRKDRLRDAALTHLGLGPDERAGLPIEPARRVLFKADEGCYESGVFVEHLLGGK